MRISTTVTTVAHGHYCGGEIARPDGVFRGRFRRILLTEKKFPWSDPKTPSTDLASVQVSCPDLTVYDASNAVHRTYFQKEFPARAFIGSGPLLRGGRFEVQGIAVRR